MFLLQHIRFNITLTLQALKQDDRLNCITEPVLEASNRAAELDSKTDQKGMLHGMPVSVKENNNIQVSPLYTLLIIYYSSPFIMFV